MFLMKRRRPIAIIILLMLSMISLTTVDAVDPRAPPGPKDLQAISRDSNIRLSWTEPDIGTLTLDNYYLYRSAEGEETRRTAIDPGTTTFSDRDVTNGKEYTYYLTALYTIGESGPSNYVYVVPDGEPPILSINSPLEGSIFGSGIISISWTGTDPTSVIDKYEVRMDANAWIDVGLKTDHHFSDLSTGDHTIQVRATDTSLNRALDSVNITMDDRPPVVVIRSPQDHTYIKEKNLTITWDAYESESQIASYEVHLNGEFAGYRGNGTSFTIDHIKDGEYWIEVLAYDIVGNLGKNSINITVDTEGPQIRIIEPKPDITMNSTMVQFKWEAFDYSDVAGYSIYSVTDGWTDIESTTEYLVGPLPEGYNELILKAIDGAGWETTEKRTILVDLTPPDIWMIHPEEGHVQSETKISVEWNGSDALSGIHNYWISVDGGGWIRSRIPQYDIRGLNTGNHTASVKAVDQAGNEVITGVMFTIDDVDPKIIDFGPIGADIPPPKEIWLEFTEEMGSITVIVDHATGRIMSNDNRYTWKPDESFEFGGNYLVKVFGEDLSGNVLEYFAWTFTVTDQVLVVGAVYDLNGDPITNARILLDSGRTSLTDNEGKFNLSAGMGKRTILISKSGFKTEHISMNLTPGRTGYVGNVYLGKEDHGGGFKIPSFVFDPWSYLVTFLVLIALTLIAFLFKEQILKMIEKVRSIRKEKIIRNGQ